VEFTFLKTTIRIKASRIKVGNPDLGAAGNTDHPASPKWKSRLSHRLFRF
jgi:hypothetical protein